MSNVKREGRYVMTDAEHGSAAGFTVVFCSRPECASGLPIRERLGAVVRQCPHGVLIGSPCPLGPAGCSVRDGRADAGPVVVVQPCTGAERRPLGPALRLGPLCDEADLQQLCRWLFAVAGESSRPRRRSVRAVAGLN
jgi:hypothetical protein